MKKGRGSDITYSLLVHISLGFQKKLKMLFSNKTLSGYTKSAWKNSNKIEWQTKKSLSANKMELNRKAVGRFKIYIKWNENVKWFCQDSGIMVL